MITSFCVLTLPSLLLSTNLTFGTCAMKVTALSLSMCDTSLRAAKSVDATRSTHQLALHYLIVQCMFVQHWHITPMDFIAITAGFEFFIVQNH